MTKEKPFANDINVRYYDRNTDGFIERTVGVDMSSLYAPFLEYVPKGGAILDAGCGSGRDAKAFLDLGYTVTAFDASKTMADLASSQSLPADAIRTGVRRSLVLRFIAPRTHGGI